MMSCCSPPRLAGRLVWLRPGLCVSSPLLVFGIRQVPGGWLAVAAGRPQASRPRRRYSGDGRLVQVLLHQLVAADTARRARECDASLVEDVYCLRDRQSPVDVLLDEQQRRPARGKVTDGLVYLVDDLRREPD